MKEEVCCRACGSLNVEYAVWFNPNTERVNDIFGTFNQDDSVFCFDCERTDLLSASDDPELFAKLRAKHKKKLAKERWQCLDPECPDAKAAPYHDHPGPQRLPKK